jgi:hypothetical protein
VKKLLTIVATMLLLVTPIRAQQAIGWFGREPAPNTAAAGVPNVA